MVLNFYGWLTIIENHFLKIFLPVKKVIYQISLKTNDFIGFVFSVRGLGEENQKLKEENERILSEISQLKEVWRENEFLKKQLGLSINGIKELVLANVIGREPSGLGEYLLIDKGNRDGIKKEEVVITSGNILVGQITEISEFFAKVRLITDLNARVNVLISESGVIGLTENREGLGFFVDLLPQEKVIEPGQMVVTSGLAGIFPSGLLVGRIEEVISTDAQISQRARVKLTSDFNALDKVFVIKQ